MREACGSNDHPDSTLFIQMYKLLSTYSLVKPQKGSNISGGEVVEVLLNIKDITDADERKIQWNDQIDCILDKGKNTEVLFSAAKLLEDHNYFEYGTSEYVLSYVAGFVARRSSRFANFKENNKFEKCDKCASSLILPADETVPERHLLICKRTRGCLIHPSVQLFDLISVLECGILRAIQTSNLNADTIFRITSEIENLSPLPFIGCDKHQHFLTQSVMRFYITTRMMFICKQANKNDSLEKEKTKERRKLSKLSTESIDYSQVVYNNKICQATTKESKRKKLLKVDQNLEGQTSKRGRKRKNKDSEIDSLECKKPKIATTKQLKRTEPLKVDQNLEGQTSKRGRKRKNKDSEINSLECKKPSKRGLKKTNQPKKESES